MIISMTGFASQTVELPLSNNEVLLLTVQLKSLNSRYFEISYKVPALFHNLEVSVYRYLKKTLHRGHVFLQIKIHNPLALTDTITPSITIIKNYLDAIEIIKKEVTIDSQIQIRDLLRLPNILHSNELDLEKNAENIFLHQIEKLTEELIANQLIEGKELKEDMLSQFKEVKSQMATIQKIVAEVIDEKKKAASEIMKKITATTDVNERSVFEVQKNTLLHDIEKSDINEEIVRFASHVKNILDFIESPVYPKGKKLDFILQEMNREINTIAAKCPHVEISAIVIDVKSKLEKAREQAQNIV